MTTPGRIFVVGAPRSGTTLVQSLLAAHDRATSFTETHFFNRHFRNLPPSGQTILVRDPNPRVAEFLAENGATGGQPLAVPGGPLRALRTRSVARQLIGLLDGLARERGRDVWIEKTPMHLHYTHFLEDLLQGEGQPRFVHVARQGAPTVASLFFASQHWPRSYSLSECIARWNGDLRLSIERVGERRHHVVFYEELIRAPEAVLRPLLAFLELDWQPSLLVRDSRTAASLITEAETWKKRLDEPLEPRPSKEERLDEAQRELIARQLEPQLYGRLRELAGPRGQDA